MSAIRPFIMRMLWTFTLYREQSKACTLYNRTYVYSGVYSISSESPGHSVRGCLLRDQTIRTRVHIHSVHRILCTLSSVVS